MSASIKDLNNDECNHLSREQEKINLVSKAKEIYHDFLDFASKSEKPFAQLMRDWGKIPELLEIQGRLMGEKFFQEQDFHKIKIMNDRLIFMNNNPEETISEMDKNDMLNYFKSFLDLM